MEQVRSHTILPRAPPEPELLFILFQFRAAGEVLGCGPRHPGKLHLVYGDEYCGTVPLE